MEVLGPTDDFLVKCLGRFMLEKTVGLGNWFGTTDAGILAGKVAGYLKTFDKFWGSSGGGMRS